MKRLGIVLLLITSVTLYAQKTPLEALQQLALNENPGIKAAFSQWYASVEKQTLERSLPDPSVAFGYFVSPVETRLGPQEYRAGVSQQIPWFGTLEFRSRAAKSQAKADYYKLEIKANRILKQVSVAYYQAWSAGKMVNIHQEQLKWLLAQKKWLEQKYRDGSKSQADILRVKMAIDRQKETIATYQDKLSEKTIQLNKLVNRGSETKIQMIDSVDVTALLQAANINESRLDSMNPELKQLHFRQEMMQYNSMAAKRSNYPAFNVGAEYIAVGERTDMDVSGNGTDAVVAKISLKLPVNVNKNKAKVAMQDFKAERFNHLYQERKNELYTELLTLQLNHQNAIRKLNLYMQQAEDARYVEQLLKSDYATGSTGFDEWLNIRRELLDYRQQIVLNKAQLKIIDAKRKMILNGFDLNISQRKNTMQ